MQISELLCPRKGGVHYAPREFREARPQRMQPTPQTPFPRGGWQGFFLSKERRRLSAICSGFIWGYSFSGVRLEARIDNDDEWIFIRIVDNVIRFSSYLKGSNFTNHDTLFVHMFVAS